MRNLLFNIALPFLVLVLGYGPLAGAAGAGGDIFLRFGLVFAIGLLTVRLGLAAGLNPTAARLAGLYWVGAPLTGAFLVSGAALAPLAWTVLLLLVAVAGHQYGLRGRKPVVMACGILVAGASFLRWWGAEPPWAWDPVTALGDFLRAGAWLVGQVPVWSTPGGPEGSPTGVMILGAMVWGIWALLAAHRALMDKMLPRHTLLMTCCALIPLLGASPAPGLMAPALVLFALFLMDFLRPSKLADSPRILLLVSFLMILVARGATACLLAVSG